MRRIPEFPYLITREGKHATEYYLARDEEELKAAVLACFHTIRVCEGYYECELDGDQQEFYEQALRGDWEAAWWLLQIRSDYEYERVWGEELGSVAKDLGRVNVHKCDTCGRWLPDEWLRSVPGCIVTSTLPSRICNECDPLEKTDA